MPAIWEKRQQRLCAAGAVSARRERLQAAQQAESESDQNRVAYAAAQAELAAARGEASELQAGSVAHGDQVAAFQQQSEG